MRTGQTHHHNARRQAHGVMLLGLLITLAISGIVLMAMVDNWAVERQRQREQELLFVGDQYRLAIQHYYYGAPSGQTRQLPTSLQAMLDDDRYPQPVHHLRRLYLDPITGSDDWGEVRVQDRLVGVFSKSEAHPLKQAGFSPVYESFKEREHYTDWVFVFAAPTLTSPAAAPVDPSSAKPVPRSPRFR